MKDIIQSWKYYSLRVINTSSIGLNNLNIVISGISAVNSSCLNAALNTGNVTDLLWMLEIIGILCMLAATTSCAYFKAYNM